MLEQELKKIWQKLKDVWKNSSETEKINSQMSSLKVELKSKISQFEKDSVKKDAAKITSSLKKILSQFRN